VGNVSATGSGRGVRTWPGPLAIPYAPLPQTFGNTKMGPTSLVGGERQASGDVGSSRLRRWWWMCRALAWPSRGIHQGLEHIDEGNEEKTRKENGCHGCIDVTCVTTGK
jgi:hypothetical protein